MYIQENNNATNSTAIGIIFPQTSNGSSKGNCRNNTGIKPTSVQSNPSSPKPTVLISGTHTFSFNTITHTVRVVNITRLYNGHDQQRTDSSARGQQRAWSAARAVSSARDQQRARSAARAVSSARGQQRARSAARAVSSARDQQRTLSAARAVSSAHGQ